MFNEQEKIIRCVRIMGNIYHVLDELNSIGMNIEDGDGIGSNLYSALTSTEDLLFDILAVPVDTYASDIINYAEVYGCKASDSEIIEAISKILDRRSGR